MGKTLVIAEKPSVAQDIVRALTPASGKFEKGADHFENEHYVVTSAVGHLVEIKEPEAYEVKRGKWSFAHLPVVPPHFDLAPIDKGKARLQAVQQRHGLDHTLEWTLGAEPFLTPPGSLLDAVQAAIAAETGLQPELSTTGGTSDGRFLARICPQVIELGSPNASIHQIDEHIELAELEPLKNIYRRVLEQLAAQARVAQLR